jgi:DNA-binding IclR family transcriptional regulator
MTSKALNETRDRSQVQSVARAVALLDALTELGGTSSAAELAEASGLDRTVVHRLLRTLSEFDLVQKDGARYSLGSAALRCAGAYLDSGPVSPGGLPYAMELQGRLGSGGRGGFARVPAGADVIVIERIWTPQMPLDAVLDIRLLPGDGSAMGRAILAGLPQDRVRTLLGDGSGAAREAARRGQGTTWSSSRAASSSRASVPPRWGAGPGRRSLSAR